MSNLSDIYVNDDVGQFFHFSVQDPSDLVHINTEIIGNIHTENDDTTNLVRISGCRLVEQSQDLTLRCSTLDQNTCGYSTNSNNLFAAEAVHTELLEGNDI